MAACAAPTPPHITCQELTGSTILFGSMLVTATASGIQDGSLVVNTFGLQYKSFHTPSGFCCTEQKETADDGEGLRDTSLLNVRGGGRGRRGGGGGCACMRLVSSHSRAVF